MTVSEMWSKFGKGAAIAVVTSLLLYVSSSVIPAIEAAGTSAILVAIIGTAVNGAKLIIQKWASSDEVK